MIILILGALFLLYTFLSLVNGTRRRRILQAEAKQAMSLAQANLTLHGNPEPERLGPDDWKPHLILLAPEDSESPWAYDERNVDETYPGEVEYDTEWDRLPPMLQDMVLNRECTFQEALNMARDPWESVPDVIASDCALAAQQPVKPIATIYPTRP